MRTLAATLAVATACSMGFAADAQQALPQPTPAQRDALQARWEALDLNHDGGLQRAEVADTPALSTRFDEIDANRDGRLSQQELRASVEDRLRVADANHDGAIDRAEAASSLPRVAQFFDRLDKDGDGRLTIEEVQQVASRFSARRAR